MVSDNYFAKEIEKRIGIQTDTTVASMGKVLKSAEVIKLLGKMGF